MNSRGMKPSLSVHNALMDAYGRLGRWDLAMRLLLQMQQAGIEPTERTFIGAIRAGASAPGGEEFANVLRPQLEKAARREAEALGVLAPDAPAPLAPKSVTTYVSIREYDAVADDKVAAGGLAALRKHIAEGTPPDARMFAAATASCAKAPGQWRDAFQIVSMMELWVREERVPKPADRIMRQAHIMYPRAQEEAIGFAYASAVAACDKSGNMDAALEILPRMEELGVPPLNDVFVSAISACRHGRPDEQPVETAQQLLRRARLAGVGPTTANYNALLAVYRSVGGMGEEALKLLRQMEKEGEPPNEITYLELIAACRPTKEQARTFKAAAYMRERERQGLNVSRRAGEPSALATGANGTLVRSHRQTESNTLVLEQDGVWTDYGALSRRALDLLDQMQLRGLQRNERHFGAAIQLCQRVGDLDEALRLLMQMPGLGLRPGHHCLNPTIQAAANIGDHRTALQLLTETEAAIARDKALVDGSDVIVPAGPNDLGLFAGGGFGEDLGPPARLSMYEAAIVACGAGYAPLQSTLALLPIMRSRGIEPAKFAYDAALHACKRKGGWREALSSVQAGRAAGVELDAVTLTRLLGIFHEVGDRYGIGPPWSITQGLIDEAVEYGLTLPAHARVHVLAAGRHAGIGWEAVRQVERLEFEEPVDPVVRNELEKSRVDDSPMIGSPAHKKLELQGELFCLAAQDGKEPDRLTTIMMKLTREGAVPSARLLERALYACAAAREERDGWTHVPALLDVAKRENLRLSEKAFAAIVGAYPPRPKVFRDETMPPQEMAELATALNVQLSAGYSSSGSMTLMRLVRLCKRVPAANVHARQLLTQRSLRDRRPKARSTQRTVSEADAASMQARPRGRPARGMSPLSPRPPEGSRSGTLATINGASRRKFAPPVDNSHLPPPMAELNGYHANGVNGFAPHKKKDSFELEVEQAQINEAKVKDLKNGFHPEDEEVITPDQGAEISQLIGRLAAHSTLRATSDVWREGGFERFRRQRERSQSPDP